MPLPAGAAYEFVWWEEGAAPDSAQAIAPVTTETQQEIDLSSLGLKRIRWTVLVVQVSPYDRLTEPGSGTTYTLAVCQMQKQTCTRSYTDSDGNTITESYECNRQVCP